jgi:hypothetical protein
MLRKQLLGVRAGLGRNLVSTEHPRELFDPPRWVQTRELGRDLSRTGSFDDSVMMIGAGSDLRQMRHAQDLSPPAQLLEHASDGRGNRAADADVDLVEHQRWQLADFGQHHLDRQSEAR